VEPPYRFQYLDISKCWPASDEHARQLLQQVLDPKVVGLARLVGSPLPPEQFISAHGILMMCLLSIGLFRDCAADQIYDLRKLPARAFRCQDRPALLVDIAQDLLNYEERLTAFGQNVRGLAARMQHAVDDLTLGAQIYRALRGQGEFPSSRSDISHAKVTAALRVLTALSQALSPSYTRPPELRKRLQRTCSTSLGVQMHESWTRYGPVPRQYPLSAEYHAMAVVLVEFGIETGTPEQVATRLRKRLPS
jgi:hypothetical protein